MWLQNICRGVLVFLFLQLSILHASAQDSSRQIALSKNGDYFGFDLRTETDISLEKCSDTCVRDRNCQAFTYNETVSWCFLKSDFGQLQSAENSLAGRIVENGQHENLGAASSIDFASAYLDAATTYRSSIISSAPENIADGYFAILDNAKTALESGDTKGALYQYGLSIALSPNTSELWNALARASMRGVLNSSEAQNLRSAAVLAAYNGYLTSRTTIDRADSLDTMGQALLAIKDGRAAIEAFKTSLEYRDSVDVRASFADARKLYGFRIVGNTTDVDAQVPRICVQFSETLADTDYTPFVMLNDATPKAVSVSGQQLCVDGLTHGERYRLTLRSGLPSTVGEVLEAPVTLNIFVPDRTATVRFTGDNFVLPGTARRGIPLVSVNADKALIDIYRVSDRSLPQLLNQSQFLSQIDTYTADQIRTESGEPVWSGQLVMDNVLNEQITTSFPVDEAVPARKPGVYVMTARLDKTAGDSWDTLATQWFVVSDIGLTTFAGEDGLTVFARSLDTAEPLANIQLQLMAKNNEILGEATTDVEGIATFAAGLTRGQGGLVPAVLSARDDGDDFVLLDMTHAGFDLSDRGVTGRPAAGPVDIFAWTDRGIYRAGETIYAQSLVRDGAANAVAGLPLTFIFTRPDGVEDRRVSSEDVSAGAYLVELKLTENAQRGAWTMRIYIDPEKPSLAEKIFLVEDFVPDRTEFEISGGPKTIGAPAPVNVNGRFLYGAPAAGLSLEGETVVKATRDWSLFRGYKFGLVSENPGTSANNEDASSSELRVPLENLPILDENGNAQFEVAIRETPDTTQLTSAEIVMRLQENGGRAVERTLALELAPIRDMIGIKPRFSDNEVPEGATAEFDIIAVNPSGQLIEMQGVQWSVLKIERNYQWYRSGSSWRYEPIESSTKVASGWVDIASTETAQISVPVNWGRFEIEVQSGDGSGTITSVKFDAGYYVDPSSTETPDGLEIALDKPLYRIGDTAQLKISPRFAGEAIVTIGTERLLKTMNISVPEGGTNIALPVLEDWGAGAYVTVSLFRPGQSESSRMPMRAIGIKWLGIDPGPRRLSVDFDVPEMTLPNKVMSFPIKVSGMAAGEKAFVTVAAVDVGILNLTNYQPPAPDDWYFGQRRLGLEIRDLYGRLIDGSAGMTGRLRTGGDGPQASSKGSPPTEKLFSLFSGVVELDAQGNAIIDFDLPQFNGTARLMAVAWSASGIGNGTGDIVVRDPVVITANTPRFMATNDEAQMLLEFANTDGPAGEYAVSVTTTPNLSAEVTEVNVILNEGARASLIVPLRAVEIGQGKLSVTLAHENGLALTVNRDINVRSESLPVTTRIEVPLAANGGTLRIDSELLAASILEGAFVSTNVSANPAFDVPALLMTLDRYPYGCAEQTTSRALPLLYVSQLARSAGLDDDPTIVGKINQAIDRVLNYQSSTGSFGLWSPGSGDLWLDAYVTDFLTRAREQGYVVPDVAMLQALENLQNTLAYNNDAVSQGSEIAYALYVLARNRRASISDLRYYAESLMDDFASPMARAHLGAGLALYGDQAGAERAFSSALIRSKQGANVVKSRSDYGSSLRDGAAILALAAETKPAISSLNAMIDNVALLRGQTRYTSTQDEAWMLLAARALETANENISLEINGQSHSGAYAKRIDGSLLLKEPLIVKNSGAQSVPVTITTVASPSQALPAGGEGFEIGRRYYKLDGTEVNISAVNQNDRFVVVLTIKELNDWPSRILVTDLLPAGFEIDNPKIVSSAELAAFTWLTPIEIAHSEYRDDRFVAAFDRRGGGNREFTFAYVVRAVTQGNFANPAASVEDMYRPQLSARTAAGRMIVSGQ